MWTKVQNEDSNGVWRAEHIWYSFDVMTIMGVSVFLHAKYYDAVESAQRSPLRQSAPLPLLATRVALPSLRCA
jgi:hypothetical protein